MANRLRGTQRPRALTNTFALPGGTREFSLQVIDLAQGWSVTVLAMVAGGYIYVKLHFTPGQEYAHALPELLDAFAAQLERESRAASPHSRKDRSFTKKRSCHNDLAVKWQSLRFQSGLKSIDCVAP